MKSQLIALLVIISLAQAADMCSISATDLNNKVLTSITNDSCKTSKCFTGDVVITVSKSATAITSLIFTAKDKSSPLASFTLLPTDQENTLIVNQVFTVQDGQKIYNILQTCQQQTINNKKVTTFSFLLQKDTYQQYLELSSTSVTPGPGPNPDPTPSSSNNLITNSCLLFVGLIVSLFI